MILDVRGTPIEVADDFLDTQLPNKTYFSHSQFNMYRRCPRQYEYRYVKGIRQAPGVAMTQGTVLHRGAEVTHRHTLKHGSPLPLDEAEAIVVDTFNDKITEIENWEEFNPGTVKDRTVDHFRHYYRAAVPVIQPQDVERLFATRVSGVPMVGFIDLIDTAQDTEVVSDLKFTSKKWPEQKITQDTQLTLYAHITGIPRVRIDFLLAHKTKTTYDPVRSIRTPHDAKIFEEDLQYVVECIKKGIFPRCDPTSWACTEKFCGYYAQCRGPQ